MVLFVLVSASCKGESRRDDNDFGPSRGGSGGTGGANGGASGTAGDSAADLDCEGYCGAPYECTGASMEACLNVCRTWESDNGELGCGPEYQAVLDCFVSTGLCDFVGDVCNDEMASYAACASRSGSTVCATICTREGQCDGRAPANCLVQCAKDARLLSDRGCSSEHDAYLICAMSHADPCELSSAGCSDEDSAALRCASR